MLKEIKNNYKLYIFITIIAILMFLPFIIFNNGIIITHGDSYELTYKLWLGGWTQFHNGNLNQFNWSLGLGANNFSYVFYFLSNPLFWISLLLPRDSIKYLFLIFTIFQYSLAFIFTHIWLSKLTNNSKARLIGSFIIAFGGYGIFYLQAEQLIKALVLYPLVLYFVEKFIQDKKIIGIPITIGILGICHYFLLYQFMPFLFIYTLIRYLIVNKDNLNLKQTIISAIQFTLLVLLGIAISAFILLPCAYLVLSMPRFSNTTLNITDTITLKQLYEVITSFFTPVMQKLDANMFIATDKFPFMGWSGVTSLYCLIITPLLCPLIFKIKDKFIRNSYLIFTLILLIFLSFKIFYYLFQATIDTRWFYMFYLLAVMINVKIIEEIDNKNINSKYLIYTSIITISIIIIALAISFFFNLNTNRNLLKLALSSIIIIILIILYLLFFQNKLPKKALLFILSLETIYSGTIYYLNNKPIDSWIYDLPISTTSISNIIQDDGFYRIMYDRHDVNLNEEDKFTVTSANEPMANGYAGFAFYESVYNTNQEEFLNRFKSTWNMPQLVGRNTIYNLLSAKYYYTFDEFFPIPYGYELINEYENGLKIYENKNYIELGFAYDKTINKSVLSELSYLQQDELMQEYLITEDSPNTTYELPNNLELLAILPDSTYREYQFNEPVQDIILYFETYGIPNVKITTYLNNEVVNTYDLWQFNYIDIPIYEPIDKVVIEGEDVYGYGTQIGLYQEPLDDTYSQDFKELTKTHFENVIFNNDHISADITINDEHNYVFTSIPYDDGWSVKVNGEEITYEKVQLGFIGFKLDEGTYHIEFDYQIPLLKEGIIVSISAIVLTGIIYIISKKKKNDNTI